MLGRGVLALAVTAALFPPPAAAGTVRGRPIAGARGVQRTTAQLQAAARSAPATVSRTLPFRRSTVAKRSAPGEQSVAAPAPRVATPRAALNSTFSFDGPALESDVFPPDTMGDVGPTQFVAAINTRLRSYDKATGVADGGIDLIEDAFWASEKTPAGCNFVSDPHIRYDRLTQRWIVIIIDVPGCTGSVSNRVLIAASDGPTISATTVWTFHHLDAPAGRFLDYPTLGVDANALYIGANDFTLAGAFSTTDAYVVRKSTILGAGAITVTPFLALLPSPTGAGPYTPQGVDNPDPAATVGHFVGVDNAVFSQLDIRRVTDPGGTPTLSGNLAVTVPSTRFPRPVPHLGNTGGNNGQLDALDDRLFAATMDRTTHHLWTAHNIGVTSSGVASGTLTRDAARWYDIDLHGDASAPTLTQSGTVFDNAATNPLSYWIPTVAVSGQGAMAIGGSVAGNAAHVNTWFSGRLPTDTAGTLNAPTTVTASSFAYNPLADPGSGSGRRWGDFSLTRVDPQDDQTLWTIQEYVSATNTWGTRVARLDAPPPATPSSPNPATAPRAASTTVTLGGTSSGGSAYWDPGPGFAKRLKVTVGCGVTVNGVTFNGPTSLSVDLDTRAAAGGAPCAVTVTNPDGQTATAAGLLNVESGPENVVISELRASGTAANDDFVELMNRSSVPWNVQAWRLDARAGDDSAAGSVTLPAQVIAPRGKLLVTAPGYSLSGLAASNDGLGGELPAGGSVALIDSANATQDAVRFAAGTVFGEGGPLGTFAVGGQYAFVRRANRSGTGDAYGLPSDTGDNAADFALVVPEGQTSSAGSALPSIDGVPGPENLSSPPLANAALQVGRLDPAVGSNVAPNREIVDPDGGGPLPQTVYLRRTATNIAGVPLTTLGFRVTGITTARSDPVAGQAVLRLESSDDALVAGKPITPVLLQRSAALPQLAGGGLNAIVTVPSITPATPLAAGASVNVEFTLRVAQGGAFQVVLNTEAQRSTSP
jgi:hypothetical protein